MFRSVILFIMSMIIINHAMTQDIILTKDSKSIHAKVLEISDVDIKYKDFDNLDGPVYTLKKMDIQTIVYQNGKVETFTPNENEPQTGQIPTSLKSYNELIMLTDNEKEDYFYKMEIWDVYKKFHDGQNWGKISSSLFKAGLGLSITGTILAIPGSVFLSLSAMNYDDGYDFWYYLGFGFIVPGGTLLGVGQILTITSIPLKVSAARLKGEAENMYIDHYLGKTKTVYLPTLNFGLTPNGLGLTLKF